MDLYNWKDQITTWKRALEVSEERIKSLRDLYFGKRCFIIGNGPSLNRVDWSLLKNEYTFGVNKIYLLFDKMGFEPSFYLCINPLVIEQSIEEISKITSEKFLPSNFIQLVENPNGITFLRTSVKQYFSTDALTEISEGYTVTFAAMQLAYFMGFSQVVLIGVDHFYQFEGTPNTIATSQGVDPNHFHPEYFGKGSKWHLPDLENSEISYNLAKNVFEEDGRVIMDGTLDGRLTIFPKINYQDIFRTQEIIVARTSKPKAIGSTSADDKQSRLHSKRYRVSVIVSTYNSEKYIGGCLEDLENQTIASEMEIIVINSGSLENEERIVFEYQKKYDNIRYIRTDKRETLYQAWNRGIAIAEGQYLTNANTDDTHTEESIEELATCLDANPNCVLAYADQFYIEEGVQRKNLFERKRGSYAHARLYHECFVGSQPMWRRNVHDEFGYFDDAFFTAGDYEFWLRIAQKYDFAYVDKILGDRLIRQDSLEYVAESLDSHFESATILKCYKYARLYGIEIHAGGLSKNPIFASWSEINLIKRNMSAKLSNKAPEDIKQIKDWRTKNESPRLSIIIVTHNRIGDLLLNLKELNAQSETDFEVIVVNNGLPIADLSDRPHYISYELCYILLQENYGPSLARNIGAIHARGNIIAILDDDARADPNWVKNILQHFDDKQLIALRGRVLPEQNRSGMCMYIPRNYDLGTTPIFSTAGIEMNSAYRHHDFMEHGGFNEYLWFLEGAELSFRIWNANRKNLDCIKYFPDVVIHHYYSTSPDHLIQAQIRIKENKRFITQRSPEFGAYLEFSWKMLPPNQRSNEYAWCKESSIFCYPNNPYRALEFAWQATQIFPFKILPYHLLAGAYYRIGKLQESISCSEIALDLLKSKIFTSNLNLRAEVSDGLKKSYIVTLLKLAYLYSKINASHEFKETIKYLDELSGIIPLEIDMYEKRRMILESSDEGFLNS